MIYDLIFGRFPSRLTFFGREVGRPTKREQLLRRELIEQRVPAAEDLDRVTQARKQNALTLKRFFSRNMSFHVISCHLSCHFKFS